MKRPIIIDTDPGIDDFFCIMLANSCELFDIKALTVITGNSYLETVCKNALDISYLFGIKTRIAKGAKKALLHEFDEPPVFVHGRNGLGEYELEPSPYGLDEKKAWDVIFEEAEKANGQLELVPTGPLTNIAIAILKYPQLKKMIKNITLMGGSTFVGNVLPYSEANIYHDAYAADIVFRSGIPITMVGLNATGFCPLTPDEVADYAKDINPTIRDVVTHLAKFRKGEPFHDCVTVATMMDDSMATYKDYFVEIECVSPKTTGRTIIDFYNELGKKPNVKVALETDKQKYVSIFKEMMKFYQ